MTRNTDLEDMNNTENSMNEMNLSMDEDIPSSQIVINWK